jgi:hypothetical protein
MTFMAAFCVKSCTSISVIAMGPLMKRREFVGLLGSAAALARDHRAKLTPYVLHDIRCTMRTHLSALPIPDLVRELVIGHAKPGLHKVYDQHAYLAEKRHALELWTKRLRDIVESTPNNVVALRAKATP